MQSDDAYSLSHFKHECELYVSKLKDFPNELQWKLVVLESKSVSKAYLKHREYRCQQITRESTSPPIPSWKRMENRTPSS